MIVAVVMVLLAVPTMPHAGTVYADTPDPINYAGDTVTCIKENGDVFGMFKPQDGTTCELDGDNVVIHYVPSNTTTYMGFAWCGIEDVTGATEPAVTFENNALNFTVPKSYCGKATPFAPLKPAAEGSGNSNGGTTGTQYYFAIPAEDKLPEASSEPVTLTITNNTGMFKAVSAYLEKVEGQTYLVMALSGSSYLELFKGTYEQAVANGDGSADNGNNSWIHAYLNADNKYAFRIPVAAGETFIPLVSVSNTYYTKYLNGQNDLARAFYPRQVELDVEAKTLVVDDYNETVDFAVTSNVEDFKVGSTASTRVAGGPNSNNYSVAPTLVMSDATYDSVTYPTVVSGAVSTATAQLADGKFEISMTNAPGKEAFKDKTPIEMTFHVAADAPYEEADTSVTRTVTIDKSAKTIVIAGEPLTATGGQQGERIDLTITNTTQMFKAVSAYLEEDGEQTYLVMALSASSYRELFKGTYEQAVANGDGSADNGNDSWIHGYLNADDKYEFRIPVADGETYIPLVSVSNSYYTKYLDGQNDLARAFYPRQAELDTEAKTLVVGDFEKTDDLTVTNNVKMFKVSGAVLHSVGGPNSNGYKVEVILTMGSGSFDKAFIGTQAEAEAAAETIAIGEDLKCPLVVRWIETPGDTSSIHNIATEPFTVSFYSVSKEIWYERVFTLNEDDLTLVINDSPKADYSAVDEAISQAALIDRDYYTDESVAALDAAVNAVVRDKYASSQSEVDAMAAAIVAAMQALEEKVLEYTFDANGSKQWKKGSTEGFSFTVHRSFDDNLTYGYFTDGGSIEIDGTVLEAEKYTVSEGSLKGTIDAEYLETLEEGKHTLKVNFFDGTAELELEIKQAGDPDDSSNTGEKIPVLSWIAMVCAFAVFVSVITMRRKENE